MTETFEQKSTAGTERVSGLPDKPMPALKAMEENGSYNRNAKLPADGGALALPFLEKAVWNVLLDHGNSPVVIADYGSSQGKNSFAPMRTAIRSLRTRVGVDRPIVVHHIDLPANDFNTLFEVLDSDPDRYSRDEPNVFPTAIGRSFYDQVLPPESVHIGWSSYAAMWLSRIPTLIPGHFVPLRSSGDVRAQFEQQAARDWRAFLSLRASELRPGGRLVIVLAAISDDGSTGLEHIFNHANATLAEMVEQGAITAEERARMVLGTCPRQTRALLAPFQENGDFEHLTVQECDLSVLPDTAWVEYEQHRNKETLAAQHALFFRSIFTPSLALALAPDRDRRAFANTVEDGMKRRLAAQPQPGHSFVHTLVLAKTGEKR
jgi:SAM dependent carboxyl methyltransferase